MDIANKNNIESKFDRRKWNKMIQEVCFDKIVAKIDEGRTTFLARRQP